MAVQDMERSFGRIRIVECGWGVSAAYAAKLLADLGVNVTKVEPPEGDLTRQWGPFPDGVRNPEKSGLFVYLNTNKRGIVLDLKRLEGRKLLDRLLERTDILIHNISPSDREQYGLLTPVLKAAHPQLIVVSISIFGDIGPRAYWRGSELIASNAGGWAFLSPGASPYPELPPLKAFGHQCDFQAGIYAATVALAAYHCRTRTGKGQHVDVSEQECVAAMLEMNLMHYSYAGRETSRLGHRALGPWFIGDCADGKVFLVCVEEDQWERLVEFMGHPSWARYPQFKDRVARGQNLDALKALMADWLAQWKVMDFYKEAQKRRIPVAPVHTMGSLLEDDQLLERGYFVDFQQPGLSKIKLPGSPSRYGRTVWALKRPAPRLGEHSEEVLCAEAGISPMQLDALRKAGIV
jgi:crotonobetainyl-CoA:carnitine CoA-transferase CaiB-like acyl-CoA transferase